MKSVLYTNPFTTKKIINPLNEKFQKPALLIANHSSFLDILVMGMLHPKLIYLVKDHVYNSKTIGSAARLSGAYPVSGGIENGEAYLKQKLAQGFSIITFPEGSRSINNKIGRFHKGAFYLAEKFDLDILPVLIHGASEVSPKDSFIIRDGGITAQFLGRITPDDKRYGETYTQRAKQVGAYVRNEFRAMRKNIEIPAYWHKTLLENFRYKGPLVYRGVHDDLKVHSINYQKLLHGLDEKSTINYVSQQNVHLPLLLALDSIDRKISAFIKNNHYRAILANNYLTQRYSKIAVCNTLESVFTVPEATLIIDDSEFHPSEEIHQKLSEISNLIVLDKGEKFTPPSSFTILLQNDTFIWYKRNT